MARTRKEWSKRISAVWKTAATEMVTVIVRVGQELIDAKAELKHGEFLAMFERNELPFGYQKANRLMAIARDRRLQSFSVLKLLPPSWDTIYKLTRLDDGTFSAMVSNGIIRPDLERNEVNKVLRLQSVDADEKRVLALKPIAGKFKTLVIDPAWEYDWLSLAGRAKPGYAMQTVEQLLELDVNQWADDRGCHLYCWVTNNFMGVACKLVEHWGFQHRTLLTWIKPPPFGLGSYFRNSTEHVLFATFGKTTTRKSAASIPTHFEAPRGEHSEKPERFYEIVRAASYPPYGEANQRKLRKDFTSLFCPVTEKLAEAAE